jgi:hypothetical protein
VARLKEFELLAIRLNDNNIEVIPTVTKKPPSETPPMKSTVDSDELLASYIARVERLEDLKKDRALGFNNNEANSSTPKANPQGSDPSLAPTTRFCKKCNTSYLQHLKFGCLSRLCCNHSKKW